MKWYKKGIIYKPDTHFEWMSSHAQIPTPDFLNDDVLRIYFSTRDKMNRSVIAFVDVEADNPQNILRVCDQPALGLGALGTFDDSGTMPSCVVNHEGEKYHYYIGWNVGTTARYRNSIGLAVSDANGTTMSRLFDGPVMDRTNIEPHFVVTPFVMVEGGIWKMWYCGCTGWYIENGITEPRYQIKYAESLDGIHWTRDNVICIPYKDDKEANTRPSVIKENGVYKMWYCYRSISDYRTDKEKSYRIGYAESEDGKTWIRKDESVNVNMSEDGWDSEMMAYPYIYERGGQKFMLYNGNGFGRFGFGYAVLASE
jgi:predicted GH43/DUF377 family glycosyl hydrolase